MTERGVAAPRLCAVSPPQTVMMRCADGVQLATDVYRPDTPGPHPVLLMRQPYGRRIASAVVSSGRSAFSSSIRSP